MADETKHLFELLNAEETQAETFSSRLGEYSIESKDEVVARAACTLTMESIDARVMGRALRTSAAFVADNCFVRSASS